MAPNAENLAAFSTPAKRQVFRREMHAALAPRMYIKISDDCWVGENEDLSNANKVTVDEISFADFFSAETTWSRALQNIQRLTLYVFPNTEELLPDGAEAASFFGDDSADEQATLTLDDLIEVFTQFTDEQQQLVSKALCAVLTNNQVLEIIDKLLVHHTQQSWFNDMDTRCLLAYFLKDYLRLHPENRNFWGDKPYDIMFHIKDQAGKPINGKNIPYALFEEKTKDFIKDILYPSHLPLNIKTVCRHIAKKTQSRNAAQFYFAFFLQYIVNHWQETTLAETPQEMHKDIKTYVAHFLMSPIHRFAKRFNVLSPDNEYSELPLEEETPSGEKKVTATNWLPTLDEALRVFISQQDTNNLATTLTQETPHASPIKLSDPADFPLCAPTYQRQFFSGSEKAIGLINNIAASAERKLCKDPNLVTVLSTLLNAHQQSSEEGQQSKIEAVIAAQLQVCVASNIANVFIADITDIDLNTYVIGDTTLLELFEQAGLTDAFKAQLILLGVEPSRLNTSSATTDEAETATPPRSNRQQSPRPHSWNSGRPLPPSYSLNPQPHTPAANTQPREGFSVKATS